MVVWKDQENRVVLDEQYVTLTIQSQTYQVCVDEFIEGEFFEFVVRSFSFLTAVEICAVIVEKLYHHLPERVVYSEERRIVPRCFGGGRGADWVVWFFGKTVRVSARGCEKIPDMTFADYVQSGFPVDIQKVIGEDNIQKITSAVHTLLPLSCMCSTGVGHMDEHGSLRHIIRKQHPFAPIECCITVAQCTVCGQRWSLQKAGDSHYSYFYTVTPFPSDNMCSSL